MNQNVKGTFLLAFLFLATTWPFFMDHEPSAFKLRAAERTIRIPISQLWLRVEFDEVTNRASFMGELRSDLLPEKYSWYLGPSIR